MQIDRSNYEIWLIDWLDGNLNDIQIDQLQHFLTENPDLGEEFDELAIFRLNPSEKSYPDKENLKKTIKDLTESQFEYLSVAYLEHDLSDSQMKEIEDIIERDPEKKMSLELIRKMKLSPQKVSYKHKNRLIRKTVRENVIRLSLIGLSAAAIFTIAVITYFSKPQSLPVKTEKTAQTRLSDTALIRPPVEIASRPIIKEKKINHTEKQIKNRLAISGKTSAATGESSLYPPSQNSSLASQEDQPRTLLMKVPVSQQIDLNTESVTNTLIALNSPVIIPVYDDGRSKLSKFIAKTFREKILKEKTVKDSPLKVYEIAEAGISGLNKLLGWEMALDKRNDENGELKSVYFSSKMLKFNAPVKKSEPVQ